MFAIKYDINMRFAPNKRQHVPVIIISIILKVELFSIEVELNHVSADNNNNQNNRFYQLKQLFSVQFLGELSGFLKC